MHRRLREHLTANRKESKVRSWKEFENKSLNRFFAIALNDSCCDYFHFYIYYQVVIAFFYINISQVFILFKKIVFLYITVSFE